MIVMIDEDDDDDEGPSAGYNRAGLQEKAIWILPHLGQLTPRKMMTKFTEAKESDASVSKQHPSLPQTGDGQITNTREILVADYSNAQIDPNQNSGTNLQMTYQSKMNE
ncbi:hypothetical protein Tco_0968844 [Tanacetum coccineum]